MKNIRIYLAVIAFTFSTLINAQIGERRDGLALGVNAGMTWNTVAFTPTIQQKQLDSIEKRPNDMEESLSVLLDNLERHTTVNTLPPHFMPERY